MGTSKIFLAKRALVTVLLSVAVAYGVALSLNRDATNANVLKAYRCVVLKVHPDKGGSAADMQKLQAAREAWVGARGKAQKDKGGPRLRALDLKHSVAKRPVLSKLAYKARIRLVCKSLKMQRVAKNCALRLKKACRMVVKAGGAAIEG